MPSDIVSIFLRNVTQNNTFIYTFRNNVKRKQSRNIWQLKKYLIGRKKLITEDFHGLSLKPEVSLPYWNHLECTDVKNRLQQKELNLIATGKV